GLHIIIDIARQAAAAASLLLLAADTSAGDHRPSRSLKPGDDASLGPASPQIVFQDGGAQIDMRKNHIRQIAEISLDDTLRREHGQSIFPPTNRSSHEPAPVGQHDGPRRWEDT